MTISTQNLSSLPEIRDLKAVCQSMALLDAILCPDWEYRYYSYDARWGDGISLASMRDGEGDHYFCVFAPRGAILKGFAHETAMSPFKSDPPRTWPGVLDGTPTIFRRLLTDPALLPEEITFCIWRADEDPGWRRGDIRFPEAADPDGSAHLLALLDGDPHTYHAWAQMYYERPVDLAAVTHIYQHQTLTPRIIRTLNPAISFNSALDEADEIGFPSVGI